MPNIWSLFGLGMLMLYGTTIAVEKPTAYDCRGDSSKCTDYACQFFFQTHAVLCDADLKVKVRKELDDCFGKDLDKCLEKVILPTVAATNSVYSPETCRTDRTLCTNYICYYAKHYKLLTECALDGNDQVDGIIDNCHDENIFSCINSTFSTKKLASNENEEAPAPQQPSVETSKDTVADV